MTVRGRPVARSPGRHWGGRRGPDPLMGVNLLDLRPVREAKWSEVEGRVVVERAAPRARGLRGVRERLDNWLATPRVRLDETGSFAWIRFDGNATVRDVVAAVREHFGTDAEPVEERLGSFVRLLRRERLVRYAGLDA